MKCPKSSITASQLPRSTVSSLSLTVAFVGLGVEISLIMERKTISADLIIDIISRLPVKDLMRFKCVSKPWLSLISSDSHLSDLQLEHAASTDLPLVVLQGWRYSSRVSYCKLYNYWFHLESLEGRNTPLREIHNPFDLDNAAPHRDSDIVASCDGILVLLQSITHSLALLNPSTGKCQLVPPNPAGNENVKFGGFGYGRECYKVVTIIKPTKTDPTLHLMIYYVNDTWRKIESNFQHHGLIGCEMKLPAVYANNVVFWHLEYSYFEYPHGTITCFDLAEEEFFEMKTPDFGYDTCEFVEMVGFDEKVCLVCTWVSEDCEEMRTDIWVLAGKCWTKLFTISDAHTTFEPSDSNEPYVQLIPECYSACRNKVLLKLRGEKLLWYNLQTEEFEGFKNQVNRRYYPKVITCKQSLVGNGMFSIE